MNFFTKSGVAAGPLPQMTVEDQLVGQDCEDLPGEHNLVDTNDLINGDILFDDAVNEAMNFDLNGFENEEMLELGAAEPTGLMDENPDIEDLIVMYANPAIHYAAYVAPMPPAYPQNNEHGNNVVVHVVPVNIEVNPAPLQQQDEEAQLDVD